LLPKVALLIPAAGSGERFGAPIPKALVQLNGRTLIEHAVLNLGPVASQIIVAAPAGFEDKFREILGDAVTVVTGGSTRTKSVKIALESIAEDIEYVLVHDAARPLASGDVIKVAEVVRDLYRRDLDRGLSAGEKRMLSKAKQILVSELALAERTDEEKAGVMLDEVLAS
jgi:2-C-methyl-D-erythritol 4-phosphate cytidylyltransferase